MRSHFRKLPTWVILIPPSREKDLTPASLITPGKQRDTNSVGEISHPVRNNTRPIQRGLSLSRCT
jgi:hypothetical protein